MDGPRKIHPFLFGPVNKSSTFCEAIEDLIDKLAFQMKTCWWLGQFMLAKHFENCLWGHETYPGFAICPQEIK